eukprot:g1508.t1
MMSDKGPDQSSAESSRRFRPRTLRINEPISVHYFNSKLRKQHRELYEWLQSEEGQRPGQVQFADFHGRVIKTEPWVEPPPRDVDIRVPKWRKCLEVDSELMDSEMNYSAIDEPPYRRSRLQRRNYIIDDSDHNWLRNSQISINDFESIVTKLERLHFKLLQTKREGRNVNGRFYVEIPSDAEVLPREIALQSLRNHNWDQVVAVHIYWLQKRAILQKPLLEEFWNQFPWSVVLDRSMEKVPVRDCDFPETPFIKSSTETQSSSVKIPLHEQFRRMKLIREDLEIARTLADQVLEREILEQKLDNVKLEQMFCELQETISSETQSLLDCCQVESTSTKDFSSEIHSGSFDSTQHPVKRKASSLVKKRKKQK